MTIAVDVAETDDGSVLAAFLPAYVEAYREPPYCEGLADVAGFAAGWPNRVAAPGFRVAVARDGERVVGFTFGHELVEETAWWEGALSPLDVDTVEWPGRTFAVLELAVLASHRRRGVASALHRRLLDGVKVERVTLLVRPEPGAAPARAAYAAWGYRKVGQIRPYADAPVYDVMVLDRV